jgi:hypothetical protein
MSENCFDNKLLLKKYNFMLNSKPQIPDINQTILVILRNKLNAIIYVKIC